MRRTPKFNEAIFVRKTYFTALLSNKMLTPYHILWILASARMTDKDTPFLPVVLSW